MKERTSSSFPSSEPRPRPSHVLDDWWPNVPVTPNCLSSLSCSVRALVTLSSMQIAMASLACAWVLKQLAM